jgi:hypothetical protein
MQIYYTNKNINCNGDGVTGSLSLLTVKRENMKDYNCIIDFGMVQSSKLKSDQLHKINGRDLLLLGGGSSSIDANVVISDILLTHSHA